MVADGVLVGPNGMTSVHLRQGHCRQRQNRCATALAAHQLAAPDRQQTPRSSHPATTSIVTRDDGKKQWAMKGKPLYYWSKDAKAGDKTGEGVLTFCAHWSSPDRLLSSSIASGALAVPWPLSDLRHQQLDQQRAFGGREHRAVPAASIVADAIFSARWTRCPGRRASGVMCCARRSIRAAHAFDPPALDEPVDGHGHVGRGRHRAPGRVASG